jgi:hypothetical protein
MDSVLHARVQRDQEIRDRLFHWLDGREVTIDGDVGTLTYRPYRAIYPYVHAVVELDWVAHDRDLVIPLTWSERLDGICRSFGLHYCRDCGRYCSYARGIGLECPCCEAVADGQDYSDDAAEYDDYHAR